MLKSMLYAAGGLTLLYVFAALALFFFQRRLIYAPDPERHTPAEAGLPRFGERILDTPDGERLVAWSVPAMPGHPTLLYFQGNAGGLIDRKERLLRFLEHGYGVLILAYRGYSGSTGRPNEEALIADAALAYESLRSSGVPARDIVAYGESLGTGVAVQLASAHPLGAVILEAPYTSIVDIAKTQYGIFPVGPFIYDRFDSLVHVGQIKAPLLILHGAKDPLIPASHGKTLFAAAPEPKELVILPKAGHSNLYGQGAMTAVARFLKTYLEGSSR